MHPVKTCWPESTQQGASCDVQRMLDGDEPSLLYVSHRNASTFAHARNSYDESCFFPRRLEGLREHLFKAFPDPEAYPPRQTHNQFVPSFCSGSGRAASSRPANQVQIVVTCMSCQSMSSDKDRATRPESHSLFRCLSRGAARIMDQQLGSWES
jgi:hypothetical protein